MVHFPVPSGRRGAFFFLRTQVYTFSNTFIKNLNLYLPLYKHGKVVVELENNTNKEFNCIYGVSDLTK